MVSLHEISSVAASRRATIDDRAPGPLETFNLGLFGSASDLGPRKCCARGLSGAGNGSRATALQSWQDVLQTLSLGRTSRSDASSLRILSRDPRAPALSATP